MARYERTHSRSERILLRHIQPVVNEALTKDPKPTWQALEKIHDSGKAKSIGVSNWTIKGLESLLSYARIPPAVNQVEAHPLLPNQKLLDYMITKKIVLAAYSPLGGQGADNPLFSDEKLAQVCSSAPERVVSC